MTCTICKHEMRPEIESALVTGSSLRNIAKQFLVSHSAVNRHRKCVADMLEAGRKAIATQTAINVDEELVFCRDSMRKLAEACLDALADPKNPGKLYVGPRSDEIEVTYFDDADDEKTRRKAKLGALIERVESRNSLTVTWAESKYADPRELLIKASSALGNHMKTYHGFKQQAELESLKQEIDQIKSLLEGQKA